MTHEFGNVLSLAHCDEDTNSRNNAIMETHYNGDNAWVTEIDKYNFEYK